MADFDIIIVGSGPAGVSAAFPLVESGLKVLMVDGGGTPQTHPSPPAMPYLQARLEDEQQWQWMIGKNFHALHNLGHVSPKLHAPTLGYVFKDFLSKNKIESKNFSAIGSLATGGLSNAWGCGVARFSDAELADFPFETRLLDKSYKIITQRIGISGGAQDDLTSYFGLDEWSQPPIEMDALHNYIYHRYNNHKQISEPHNFRLGRTRVAALSIDHSGRKACDRSNNCLWGCHRHALYSAAEELPTLKSHANFHHEAGFVVDNLSEDDGFWSINGKQNNEHRSISANKILLAAGTLATTRLALKALGSYAPVKIYSCPAAAFLLWVPKMLGSKRGPAFGLGQLSFALDIKNGISGFGATLGTSGLPISGFARYLPLRRRYSVDFLGGLLSSCLIGSFFLPGQLSNSTAMLNADGSLYIEGAYNDDTLDLMDAAKKQIRKEFARLGAIMLPTSFTVSPPGADIHYASTLPMRYFPTIGETNPLGELYGLKGIYIVDGASLSTLPEKSHTLTIMANADRIGRELCNQMK